MDSVFLEISASCLTRKVQQMFNQWVNINWVDMILRFAEFMLISDLSTQLDPPHNPLYQLIIKHTQIQCWEKKCVKPGNKGGGEHGKPQILFLCYECKSSQSDACT